MSELRPKSPTQRPDDARARGSAAAAQGEAEPTPEIEPPSPEELGHIQEHLASLPVHEGATVSADADLGVLFVRGFGSGPDATYAAMPRWEADTWRASLHAVRDRMRDEGAWPSLLLCDDLDRPAGMGARLEQEGWTRVTTETVMWVGHASVVPHLDPTLRIEALQPRSVAKHEAIERQIFGIAEGLAEQRRKATASALEEGTMRGWIVWLEQEPVAVARLSQGKGVAALQGIGVTRVRRNQGFGRLITTIATRAGMAVGNRNVWLSVREDDPAAVKVYARLGFASLFTWTRWILAQDPRPNE